MAEEVTTASSVSAAGVTPGYSIEKVLAAVMTKSSGRVTGNNTGTTKSKELRSNMLHELKRSQIKTEIVTYNTSTSGERIPAAKSRRKLGRKTRRHRRKNHRRRKERKRQKKPKGKRKKRRKLRRCSLSKKDNSGD